MTLENLEFRGVEIRVEFEHVPDEPGRVGYCIVDHVYLNEINWYSRGCGSNLLTSGAIHIIQYRVEAHMSALAQLSKADRKAMAEV